MSLTQTAGGAPYAAAQPVTARDDASPMLAGLLARFPPHVRATFTDEQIRALGDACRPTAADHLVDYRASIPILNRRFYFRLLVGNEKRSFARLTREEQVGAAKVTLFAAFVGWVALSSAVLSLAVVLYLVKSALGIDLFDGPSAMHQFFFD